MNTNKITKTSIKNWAEANRISYLESAYVFVERHVRYVSSYKSAIYCGHPSVIPTKAAACRQLADHYADKNGDFSRQVARVARDLERYYQQKGA